MAKAPGSERGLRPPMEVLIPMAQRDITNRLAQKGGVTYAPSAKREGIDFVVVTRTDNGTILRLHADSGWTINDGGHDRLLGNLGLDELLKYYARVVDEEEVGVSLRESWSGRLAGIDVNQNLSPMDKALLIAFAEATNRILTDHVKDNRQRLTMSLGQDMGRALGSIITRP